MTERGVKQWGGGAKRIGADGENNDARGGKGDPSSTHLGHDLVQLRLGDVEEVLKEVAPIQEEVVLDGLQTREQLAL